MTTSPDRVPENLNLLVDWTKALTAMDVGGVGNYLPCTVRCPGCANNTLTIYQDTTLGGQWGYCKTCRLGGDLIKLVSRWTIGHLHTALAWLYNRQALTCAALPSTERLNAYDAWYSERIKQTTLFWGQAQVNLVTGKEGASAFQFIDETDRSRLADGIGRFVGVATREQVAAFLAPHNIRHLFPPAKRHGVRRSWQNALIIPFQDFPGRISAFAHCIHEGYLEPDVAYVGTASALPNSKVQRPGGIAMLDALLQPPTEPFHDTAFVLLDPILALHLQTRHLAHSLDYNLLPVVGLWPGADEAPLRVLAPTQNLVFWAPKLTADVFRHARKANAKIAVCTAAREKPEKQQSRYAVSKWLKDREDQALPWGTVLEEHLRTLPPVEAEALLTQAGLTGEELRQFIAGCGKVLRERLGTLFTQHGCDKCVNVSKHTVIETERGWELLKPRELICDAKLRVDEVIHLPGSGRSYGQGYVVYKGEELPFTAELHELETKPFLFMRKLLIEHNKGLLHANQQWQRHGWNIAQQFHPPKLVRGVDHYGWDPVENRWVFPGYFIDNLGNVHEHKLPRPKVRGLPALNLGKPQELLPDQVELLHKWNDPAVPALWSLLTAVLHNLLASPYAYVASGIAVVGDESGRRDCLTLAQALGCPIMASSASMPAGIAERIQKEEADSAWPVPIEGFKRSPGWRYWFELKPHNCVLGLDELTAYVGMVNGGWFYLEAANRPAVEPKHLEVAAVMLPSFLQWLAKRRMERTLWSESLPLNQVIADLSAWFREAGGAVDVAARMNRKLTGEYKGCVTDYFAKLLMKLYEEGAILSRRVGFKSAQKTSVIFMPERDGLWIPKSGVNVVLGHRNLPGLNIDRVTRALNDENVLLDECDCQGTAGWLVTEAWWNEQQKQWRGGRKTELKLAR
jgi:hypothetical protein